MKYKVERWEAFRFSQYHNWKIKTGEDSWFIDCGMAVNSEANAKLIIAAVNACISLNPSNPMAVAEGLPQVIKEIKGAKRALTLIKGWIPNEVFIRYLGAVARLKDALSAITKPTKEKDKEQDNG
jgi:hypothetical protein